MNIYFINTSKINAIGYKAIVVEFPINYDEQNVNLKYDMLNINSTTYLSLRDIANILNIDIVWDNDKKSIHISRYSNSNKDTILKNAYPKNTYLTVSKVNFPIYIDGIEKHTEKMLFSLNGISYISLRDLANILDIPIYWSDIDKSISIYSSKQKEFEIKNNIASNKVSKNTNRLRDNKIINMNFSEDELDYILNDKLDEYEKSLFDELNKLRIKHKVAPIELSMELTKVARVHSLDFKKNQDEILKNGNLHGWSISPHWSGGGYPKDHSKADIMWSKPYELSNFNGYGYEISYKISNNINNHPQKVIQAWHNSIEHNKVMLSKEYWNTLKYAGVGAIDGYACIWFAKEEGSDKYVN